MATRTAVAAPARADQCGFTRSPAIRVNRTMIGRAATSAECHQCPKGSYTCVQVGIVSPDYGRWASFYVKLISEHFHFLRRVTNWETRKCRTTFHFRNLPVKYFMASCGGSSTSANSEPH